MKNIGEKLEQARSAKGLSLKDAVAYTKIKQEFLESMEKNDFSFNLPDVYRRGFLRLYSDYLKLNTEEIMQEYKSMQNSSSSSSHVNLLGKIAANESKLSNEALNNVVEADVVDTSERFDSNKDYFDAPPAPLEYDSKFNYIKIALIGSSIFLGILILFLLIRSISSGSEDVAVEENLISQSSNASNFILSLTAKPSQSTYVSLYYEGEKDTNPIYVGEINSTTTRDFEIKPTGALLEVTDAEKLRIFKNSAEIQLPDTLKGSRILNATAP